MLCSPASRRPWAPTNEISGGPTAAARSQVSGSSQTTHIRGPHARRSRAPGITPDATLSAWWRRSGARPADGRWAPTNEISGGPIAAARSQLFGSSQTTHIRGPYSMRSRAAGITPDATLSAWWRHSVARPADGRWTPTNEASDGPAAARLQVSGSSQTTHIRGSHSRRSRADGTTPDATLSAWWRRSGARPADGRWSAHERGQRRPDSSGAITGLGLVANNTRLPSVLRSLESERHHRRPARWRSPSHLDRRVPEAWTRSFAS
jgi:hypothetical protein